ncbi:MAG: inositol monophosphatase family protein [Myxococcota bacterium]
MHVPDPNATDDCFGVANASLVKRSMVEAVQRGIQAIRRARHAFESESKGLKDGGGEDFVTSADRGAQAAMVKVLSEDFPHFGIVAEEDGLHRPSTHPDDLWFSLDPLDGTSAFRRRQSGGFGPMLALARGETVIAAFVGDAMTQEVFGYKPGSDKVWRSAPDLPPERLEPWTTRRLAGQYVLLRDNPWAYSARGQALCLRTFDGPLGVSKPPLFAGMETANGSIGLSFARLWKGEVGAHLLRPNKQTPWDLLPVLGISLRLGFVFLRLGPDGALTPFVPRVSKEVYRTDDEVLVVHERHVSELLAWCGVEGV